MKFILVCVFLYVSVIGFYKPKGYFCIAEPVGNSKCYAEGYGVTKKDSQNDALRMCTSDSGCNAKKCVITSCKETQ